MKKIILTVIVLVGTFFTSRYFIGQLQYITRSQLLTHYSVETLRQENSILKLKIEKLENETALNKIYIKAIVDSLAEQENK
ncbi:MAG: hypothetical protein WC942_04210 [Clostridia bacterium]